eukprot:2363801-Prymnesium_polylepis.1
MPVKATGMVQPQKVWARLASLATVFTSFCVFRAQLAQSSTVFLHRFLPVLHHLCIVLAHLPVGLRDVVHLLPHPHAKEIAPAPLSRWAFCGVAPSGRRALCSLAWARAVAVLPSLPVARLAAGARRLQAHQAALPRDLPERAHLPR